MFINGFFKKLYCEYYRRRFRNSYVDLRFHPQDSTFEYGNIDIGKHVFINRRAYFSAPAGEIIIGDNVLIGADVFFASGNHNYAEVGILIQDQMYGKEKYRISVDDDVWIASKVSILGNVHIHEGTVIGAGSIVLHDMPPYCVCVGSPCKPQKLRYSDSELREHYSKLGKRNDAVENIVNLRRDILKLYGLECLYD